jgi:hypothetical protein
MKRTLRWISLGQLAGFACLVVGVVLIFRAFDHNNSLAGSYCVLQSGPGALPGQACLSSASYILPAVLAGIGYVTFMGGFLGRFLVLKRYGRPTFVPRPGRSMAQRHMQVPPGMPGSPFGSPGEPPGFVGGVPPGTPGSPTGPPL